MLVLGFGSRVFDECDGVVDDDDAVLMMMMVTMM